MRQGGSEELIAARLAQARVALEQHVHGGMLQPVIASYVRNDGGFKNTGNI